MLKGATKMGSSKMYEANTLTLSTVCVVYFMKNASKARDNKQPLKNNHNSMHTDHK